jgi:hypothetical protein
MILFELAICYNTCNTMEPVVLLLNDRHFSYPYHGVSAVGRLWAEKLRSGTSIASRVQTFSLLHSAQMDTGANPSLYPVVPGTFT